MPAHPQNLLPHYDHSACISTATSCCAMNRFAQLINLTYSGASLSANLAMLVPFTIYEPVTVRQLAWFNGSTVAGNVDVGIIQENKVRVGSTGSTAMSGASTTQIVNVTDFTLRPGGYFFDMVSDSSTATFNGWTFNGNFLRSMGHYEAATSFPIPSTLGTLQGPTLGRIPLIMAILDTQVL